MDVFLFCILLLTALVNLILAILIIKHYVRTRYVTSLILALFFITKGSVDWLYLPVAWLGDTAGGIIVPFYIAITIIHHCALIFLLIFFEAVFGNPLSPKTAPCIAYYGFLVCYALTMDWNFEYSGTRGWNPVYTPQDAIVFGGYMLIIFLLVAARFFQSVYARNIKSTNNAIEIESVSIMRVNKLVVIWLGGFLLGQFGIGVTQILEIEYVGYILGIIGILVTAFSYLYDPHAFFLSSAEIQAVLFFDAGTGLSFLAYGLEMDDNLAAGGLLGSLTLQQEIMGTKKYPTLQVFGDKVFLLAYEKVGETLVAGAIIMNRYLQAMYPTLDRALHVFIARNKSALEQWHGGGERSFENVLPELLSIFEFAWSKKKRAEIKQLTVSKSTG